MKYPEYDILKITVLENGDLHLENDGFWFPAFSQKMMSTLGTKVAKSRSTICTLEDCCNSLIVPADNKDNFYSLFGNLIVDNVLKFKTDYNERSEAHGI